MPPTRWANFPRDRFVFFTLAEGRQLIVGNTEELLHIMTPLLGWDASRTRAWVVCAVRKQGKGHIVFRPRDFHEQDEASQQFADRLREWRFSVARPPKEPCLADPRVLGSASTAA